ncbi:class B sortase [Yeguia hominis]|uniref:Class B sortase n=1 Tax=Yeguia hominis TaxID=2763662 RepID=A0A926D9X1_9FIRM|nr:class B sortase [Yeguia hominis]MBC8533489.1 class B sortase [Yeguia hominis]
MKKITKIIRPIICMAVLLFAMTMAGVGCSQKEAEPAADSSAAPSASSAAEPQPTAPPAGEVIPTIDRQAELAQARAKNPDAVAWLYIPGAEVDDPVMQAEDNGYYLNLDETGAYAMWGCYYAHCENQVGGRDELDKNTTIFGHSASNCDPDGPKFTKLYRYMDAAFVKQHPYLYLSVDGEDMIFQITALFVTDIAFDYIAPNPTGNDLTSFFETVARKNWFAFDGVTFSEEDPVLTLSTCCQKYDTANTGNQRLVVMAKLLPEGAIAQDFSVSLVENPEMP